MKTTLQIQAFWLVMAGVGPATLLSSACPAQAQNSTDPVSRIEILCGKKPEKKGLQRAVGDGDTFVFEISGKNPPTLSDIKWFFRHGKQEQWTEITARDDQQPQKVAGWGFFKIAGEKGNSLAWTGSVETPGSFGVKASGKRGGCGGTGPGGEGGDDSFEAEWEGEVLGGEIQITAVEGLRKEAIGNFSQETDPHAAGRLFVDTREDWDGGVLLPAHYDRQRVKITVEIKPRTLDLTKYQVRWELRDPDDPADHAQVDPNGLLGGDNTGSRENADHWFTQADHAISSQADQAAVDETTVVGEAKTSIDKAGDALKSSVFFNFSDDGGDNWIVRAVLVKDTTEGKSDSTGTLTVWRKRFVQVHAMRKANDDVQVVHPPKVTPPLGPHTIITAGANGQLDTLVRGGDDEYFMNSEVRSGRDRVSETTANSGGVNFYPSSDATLMTLINPIQLCYSSTGDMNTYLDFVVSQGNVAISRIEELLTVSGTGEDSLNEYTRDVFHALGEGEHIDGVFHLVGIAATDRGVGVAHQTPHILVSVRKITLSLKGKPHIDHTAVHELGHAVMNDLGYMHDLHSPTTVYPNGRDHPDCAFDDTRSSKHLCPRHIKQVRSGVARTWPPHAITEMAQASAMDS